MESVVRIFRYLISEMREQGYLRDADLTEGFFLHCRTKNLSAHTLRCYADRIGILLSYAHSLSLDLSSLSEINLLRYIDSALRKNSAETVNGRLRAWRVLYNYLYDSGYLPKNPMAGVKLVRVRHACKPILSADEVSTLINSCANHHFIGVRNRCMILLLYDSKLRVGELTRLKPSDIDFAKLVVRVEHAKGGSGRPVAMTELTGRELHRYLALFRKDKAGDRLFVTHEGCSLSEVVAYRTISRIGKRVGISVHPHKLRHSGATSFVDNGGDMYVLKEDLGHASIETTQIYVHGIQRRGLAEARKYSPAHQLKIVRKRVS